MNWKKDKFTVIKNAINEEMADFLKNYILLKRRVARTFLDTNHIPPFTQDWGNWDDPQVPGTYAYYGDVAMETMLQKLKPKMELTTNLKLFENYAYTRISNSKGIEVNLEPGDMLVYRGDLLEHWRDPFMGQYCAQVFLHYNNKATKGSEENALDRRPHLGLPNTYRRAEKKIPQCMSTSK